MADKQIKCGCGSMAFVRMTKQNPNAKRRMKPRPYIACPKCGSFFNSNKAYIERILSEAVEIAEEQEKIIESDNSPSMSDNNQQQTTKKPFFGWSNRV